MNLSLIINYLINSNNSPFKLLFPLIKLLFASFLKGFSNPNGCAQSTPGPGLPAPPGPGVPGPGAPPGHSWTL